MVTKKEKRKDTNTKRQQYPSVPFSFLTVRSNRSRPEVQTCSFSWLGSGAAIGGGAAPPPSFQLSPGVAPPPSFPLPATRLLPPPHSPRRRSSHIRVWGVPTAARLLARARLPAAAWLVLTPPRSDEDTTPSHTTQGEEEVQHGSPIHLSHGGGPVQLKLEPISDSRTSL